MKRREIENLIETKQLEITKLNLQIRDLELQNITLSDEDQQYYEKEVEVIVSKRPKKVENRIHGYITWKEDMKDEGSGEVVSITRNQLVKVGDRWLV